MLQTALYILNKLSPGRYISMVPCSKCRTFPRLHASMVNIIKTLSIVSFPNHPQTVHFPKPIFPSPHISQNLFPQSSIFPWSNIPPKHIFSRLHIAMTHCSQSPIFPCPNISKTVHFHGPVFPNPIFPRHHIPMASIPKMLQCS